MKGKKRFEFMYNKGINYGAIGYYDSVDEAFNALKTFLPYKDFEIGKGEYDFSFFEIGYKKARKVVNRVARMKAQAQEKIKEILSEA